MEEGKGAEGGKGNGDGIMKEKGKMIGEERRRKDSVSSASSVSSGAGGSLDLYWGKKRKEREGEEGMEEEGKGAGFKKSVKTKRSPEGGGKREGREEKEELGNVVNMIRELMKEVREEEEEMRKGMREVREEMRKEREERRKVMEEWREERRRWEEKKRREKMEEKVERMGERDGRMEEMIERIERWEREREGRGGREPEDGGEIEECRLRLRRMELRQDKKEREERRNNVVVRGMRIEGEEVEKEVKKLWARMGVDEGGIGEVRRVGRTGKEGNGLVLVKLKGREEKRKVMEARRKLKGRRERIDDDLTEEKRRAR